ncbi:hypothetical protein C2G38_2185703 [Gigaspora rosea]|uniref:Helicase superfamily 3 single-stranded DNA/RNA virus domain-containing protein n=1 Tax=Gigaspora rosea TaxID=44941 RepID=A0A397V7M0_9GLOM|nr:hypothetical protein C2G38_2185703 [Gigaspora rosea]
MCILNWIKKYEFEKKLLEDETIYHSNIQGVRSTKAIIIEKEIKEGRYITNNKLAKEYPKTYTLYNKRLIDWKTKIEEQYYKSLGKPFDEFHYGDKMYGKSSYTKNFNEKIAYWFDNKNLFDGYDKQPILILDDFDGTQLYYSAFLKILSGQQRRLEIKGSKELNYIKHVIITSNYSLKELYRKDDYNQDQLDWRFDTIWNYKKQYLDLIDYFQYFEENWETVNNLDITKNIFHNNYSSISFNNNYQNSEPNNNNYLPIEKIRTILAKRNKNNQSDSETSSINSQDSENTKRYKQKKSKMPKLLEDIWKKIA